jgi:hypothetical protein
MTPFKFKPVTVVVGLGAAVGIVTAVQAPAYASGSLAFIGGLFGGAAMASNSEREKVQSRERATRVASCFSTLYEKNNGVIDPVELSFLSNIPVQESHDFLSTIAEANGGQKISIKEASGCVNYPHTTNALDTLSKTQRPGQSADSAVEVSCSSTSSNQLMQPSSSSYNHQS